MSFVEDISGLSEGFVRGCLGTLAPRHLVLIFGDSPNALALIPDPKSLVHLPHSIGNWKS
jgi:hypothetical protein